MLTKESCQIIETLKPGGQKQVFLVNHNDIGQCVLKIGRCSSLTSLERIKREVNILRDIKSPLYPQNYYYDNDSKGNFEILEEYIDSTMLREVMTNFSSEKQVISLIIKLIAGLSIIWDKEIVHRDLKPENILIRKSNHLPVIIDLGIARDLKSNSLTKSIFHAGPHTQGYCSPEQLTNNKDAISYKSDFFSIGILMAELLTNHNPFSPSINGCGLNCNDNILSNTFCLENGSNKISNNTTNIIKRLLAPYPYLRYRTYNKLLEDLKEVLCNG